MFTKEGFSGIYINVNGTQLYYKKSGHGSPFILLHGNGEDHTIFDVLTRQLSKNYTVYAIDSRGHGKSAKAERLDYQVMMEDVAAFIKELGIQKPILYGFSDGGIIGLLLAIKYPDILSKLTISGANTHPDGMKPATIALIKITYFFTRSEKLKLMLTQPDITKEELNKIAAPTLILAGSNDVIKLEHTKMIAENIKGSTFKIIEGENHSSYVVNSEKLYEVMRSFLYNTAKH